MKVPLQPSSRTVLLPAVAAWLPVAALCAGVPATPPVLAAAASATTRSSVANPGLATGRPAGTSAHPAAFSPIRTFVDVRDPPFYTALTPAAQAQAELGHAVFNTQWVVAGTANAGRRDGVGPLYNADACDACHNNGARGRGPIGGGDAPASLVVQLELPAGTAHRPPAGDPRYGHELNTAAIAPLRPEGSLHVDYSERHGHYPDGTPWQLRAPHYEVSGLRLGPLSPRTLIKPRLAPQLFGIGLLEAVPEATILRERGGEPAWQWLDGRRALGRFGWQGASVSIRDQTTKAFSREMGLTTHDRPRDDCTAAQPECRAQPDGGQPEVSDAFLDAVVAFQRWLAVPEVPHAADAAAMAPDPAFVTLGCAACHRPQLPARWRGGDGRTVNATIAPYTDLRLHDLGSDLADTDSAGHTVRSQWLTPPLWTLGYRLASEHHPTFLHDGRARSIEEAILWHGGEASAARTAFEQLPAAQRQALLRWLAQL